MKCFNLYFNEFSKDSIGSLLCNALFCEYRDAVILHDKQCLRSILSLFMHILHNYAQHKERSANE